MPQLLLQDLEKIVTGVLNLKKKSSSKSSFGQTIITSQILNGWINLLTKYKKT